MKDIVVDTADIKSMLLNTNMNRPKSPEHELIHLRIRQELKLRNCNSFETYI